jgi:ring-1,2-phenylacetyl-CoA epoxidase subunit PaaD
MVTDIPTTSPSIEAIWEWLNWVSDPEIPVLSIVDLGIVRQIRWSDEGAEPTLLVTITPTYSGCPAMAVIKEDIVKALHLRGISRIRILTQLSPAWTTDWMSEEGRLRLREYGIAPPLLTEHEPADSFVTSPRPCKQGPSTAVACPRCGSADTRLVSRFGSTLCKAFFICNSCREPFDYFKCH